MTKPLSKEEKLNRENERKRKFFEKNMKDCEEIWREFIEDEGKANE